MFADEQGNPVTLQSLIHAPVILNLAYYTCNSIRPQVFAGIAQALPKLQLTPRQDYTVLTVSFDENDTPQIARETKKKITSRHWKSPFPMQHGDFSPAGRKRSRPWPNPWVSPSGGKDPPRYLDNSLSRRNNQPLHLCTQVRLRGVLSREFPGA